VHKAPRILVARARPRRGRSRQPHGAGERDHGDEQADHAEQDAAFHERDRGDGQDRAHRCDGAPDGRGLVEPGGPRAQDDEQRERQRADHRVERGATLLGPIDVLEANPQRELVEREAGAHAEGDRHQVPVRGVERCREGQEAREQHQADAPHEVMDVHATRVHAAGPPAHAACQARARPDHQERDEERHEHDEPRAGARPQAIAERVAGEDRSESHGVQDEVCRNSRCAMLGGR
jgi:hypothetical protein